MTDSRKQTMVDISLVIPCFNEEDTLSVLYKEANCVLAELIKAGSVSTREYIFVDDGSKDNTLSIFRQLANDDNNVHYLSFSRNFGKEAALLAGLQTARGTFVVTLDADGQDPPSLIPLMLEAVISGEYDCAGTRRINRAGEPPIRSFFARRFYALMKKITDVEIIDGARDFRLMNRKYMDAILALPERNRFSKCIFPWIGYKTKWFEYENIARTAGKTKWSFWKLLLYSLDGIIAFSSKPLAIASVMGIFLFLSALAFIVFIIVRRLIWGDPVSGWASTICIILFCSGIQLFTTGILGQYMAKIHTEVKQRPQYIIREAQ
ncbi:MAG: glycosyltransferase family 2 protein [Treponema sp.]|jgi:glycosyltransferase involved in cell wall biosynthesis|nr:glycosyltransferase family 2 protein [Treponema sp.]